LLPTHLKSDETGDLKHGRYAIPLSLAVFATGAVPTSTADAQLGAHCSRSRA
jgi:hypothetical protein